MNFYVVNSKNSERICEVGNFAGHDDFDNEVYTGDIIGFFKLSNTNDRKTTPQVCGYAIVIDNDDSNNELEFIIIEKNFNGKMEVLPKGVIKSYKDISYEGYKYLNSNYCINEIERNIRKDDNTLELAYGNITIENDDEYGNVIFYTEISCEPQYIPIDKEDIPEVIKFLQSVCDKENDSKIQSNEMGD